MSDSSIHPKRSGSVEENAETAALQRLLAGVDAAAFPSLAVLREELAAGVRAAAAESPAPMNVMNPVMRPVVLALAPLAADDQLDTMYAQEWAEFSVSHEGGVYLVYRRRDGNNYAIEWSPATTLPSNLLGALSPALLAAVTAERVDP